MGERAGAHRVSPPTTCSTTSTTATSCSSFPATSSSSSTPASSTASTTVATRHHLPSDTGTALRAPLYGHRSAGTAQAPTAPSHRHTVAWQALLKYLELEQYTEAFVEEEMTSIQLLEEIVGRADGEKELMEALKEMGIKKMGHRQSIVGAIVGRI